MCECDGVYGFSVLGVVCLGGLGWVFVVYECCGEVLGVYSE